MSDVQLQGALTLGGIDCGPHVSSMIIHRTRNTVTIPPTLDNIRESSAAGALVESLEIRFHSSLAATALWAELYDAIDTDTAELAFTGCLFNDAVAGVDNPEFAGTIVVLGVDTGADVAALREQTQTYPITRAGVTKSTGA